MRKTTQGQKKLPFTREEALKIQTDQIEELSFILKPEIIEILKNEAAKHNSIDTGNPFDIWRGTDIENFVMNYAGKLYYLRKGKQTTPSEARAMD